MRVVEVLLVERSERAEVRECTCVLQGVFVVQVGVEGVRGCAVRLCVRAVQDLKGSFGYGADEGRGGVGFRSVRCCFTGVLSGTR